MIEKYSHILEYVLCRMEFLKKTITEKDSTYLPRVEELEHLLIMFCDDSWQCYGNSDEKFNKDAERIIGITDKAEFIKNKSLRKFCKVKNDRPI